MREHKQQADGRWLEMSFVVQMANVDSEVSRALNWRQKGNQDYSAKAFERALELLDLTIADNKNKSRGGELLRAREVMVDYFVFDNCYQSTEKSWRNYFGAFTYANALQRGV